MGEVVSLAMGKVLVFLLVFFHLFSFFFAYMNEVLSLLYSFLTELFALLREMPAPQERVAWKVRNAESIIEIEREAWAFFEPTD